MTFDLEFLWMLLSLPMRILCYIAHVYLLNVIALHQLICLLLKMLMQAMYCCRRTVQHLQISGNQLRPGGQLLHVLYHGLSYLLILIVFLMKMLCIQICVLRHISLQLRH
ncbi:hypothetical protein KR222_004063 [Zaprionus bogoriensis]|nr:hypothetical protein KR222_004063 [Zaprionus bogoriensis]